MRGTDIAPGHAHEVWPGVWMLRWIADLVGSLGYAGVAVLMALENVVLPLPSEAIMPLAGFEAGLGRMGLEWVILAGTIGSTLGALPVYALARVVGEERLSRWVERYGRWLLLDRRDIDRASHRFSEHDVRAVALRQLLPGLRGLIAIPAGFARMNVVWFTLANFAGTLVWCTVLAIAGEQLGAHYMQVDRVLGPIGWGLLAAGALGTLVWWWRRHARGRQRR